jgi:hypothetical protein
LGILCNYVVFSTCFFLDTFVPNDIFNITTCYPCDFVILSSRKEPWTHVEYVKNTWETEHKCVENCSSVSWSPDLWRAERYRCVLISHSLHVWYVLSCLLCLHPIFLGWVEWNAASSQSMSHSRNKWQPPVKTWKVAANGFSLELIWDNTLLGNGFSLVFDMRQHSLECAQDSSFWTLQEWHHIVLTDPAALKYFPRNQDFKLNQVIDRMMLDLLWLGLETKVVVIAIFPQSPEKCSQLTT